MNHRSSATSPKRFFKFGSNELRTVPSAKPLILCLEDDPAHLHLRKELLEKEDYRVVGVSSAVEALETLRKAPVCCTIADHMLQGPTGIEIAEEMKRIKPDVPIVLHSSAVPDRIQGIDVYINKGEPTETFLRIVHNVVQRYCS
jgi:CheY-like chemotaxis protein